MFDTCRSSLAASKAIVEENETPFTTRSCSQDHAPLTDTEMRWSSRPIGIALASYQPALVDCRRQLEIWIRDPRELSVYRVGDLDPAEKVPQPD